MDKQDREDIKSILNEQMDYIHSLIKYVHENLPKESDITINSLTLLSDIDECNMVMMEIVEGPKGTVKRLV